DDGLIAVAGSRTYVGFGRRALEDRAGRRVLREWFSCRMSNRRCVAESGIQRELYEGRELCLEGDRRSGEASRLTMASLAISRCVAKFLNAGIAMDTCAGLLRIALVAYVVIGGSAMAETINFDVETIGALPNAWLAGVTGR